MKPRFRVALLARRFSLKTLLILVAVACVYFACWKATCNYLARPRLPRSSFALSVREISSPAPFLIVKVEADMRFQTIAERRYYLWFFGDREYLVHRTSLDPSQYSLFSSIDSFQLSPEAQTQVQALKEIRVQEGLSPPPAAVPPSQ